MLSVINKQFIAAAQNNQLDELKKLLNQGADIHADDDDALIWAAADGHLKVVKFLVTHGANIHANDDEALRWAAVEGHLEVVKLLVTKGANIHANDDSALIEAARHKHHDVFQVLSAFILEEKLLVAALDFMPLVAASDSTSASSWVYGMPVLPAVASMTLVAAVGVMPQTKLLAITKTKRSKI